MEGEGAGGTGLYPIREQTHTSTHTQRKKWGGGVVSPQPILPRSTFPSTLTWPLAPVPTLASLLPSPFPSSPPPPLRHARMQGTTSKRANERGRRGGGLERKTRGCLRRRTAAAARKRGGGRRRGTHLVTGEGDDDVRVSLPLELLDPGFGLVKRGRLGHVVDDDGGACIPTDVGMGVGGLAREGKGREAGKEARERACGRRGETKEGVSGESEPTW